MTGVVRVVGAKAEDWEAVAVGTCPAGSCIYVADIGDNDATRSSITVYRFPEPEEASGSVNVTEAFHARFPGGGQDAEALLVTPDGGILIVTKGETGPVALFRFPQGTKPGATVELQALGKPRDSGRTSAAERITDGAVSPSGTWIALRTPRAVLFFDSADLLAGHWREKSRVALDGLGEPQGEGIAFGDDKTIYLVGEGGGKSQPGTFARLTCTF